VKGSAIFTAAASQLASQFHFPGRKRHEFSQPSWLLKNGCKDPFANAHGEPGPSARGSDPPSRTETERLHSKSNNVRHIPDMERVIIAYLRG